MATQHQLLVVADFHMLIIADFYLLMVVDLRNLALLRIHPFVAFFVEHFYYAILQVDKKHKRASIHPVGGHNPWAVFFSIIVEDKLREPLRLHFLLPTAAQHFE